MGTSSSSNRTAWTAKALIFSGRPDLSWTLSDVQVERFLSLWRALPAASDAMSAAAALGYRGCIVAGGADETWHAYDGFVVHALADRRDARRDIDRAAERSILTSAPPGLLPENLIA